ncbi:MAG: hypothetical protein Q4C47_07620, partial [Planctomycetia bacterium]|nr:hypothetical protein [Planctomycetia bacterium]
FGGQRGRGPQFQGEGRRGPWSPDGDREWRGGRGQRRGPWSPDAPEKAPGEDSEGGDEVPPPPAAEEE